VLSCRLACLDPRALENAFLAAPGYRTTFGVEIYDHGKNYKRNYQKGNHLDHPLVFLVFCEVGN
jgi:hypothetical protein